VSIPASKYVLGAALGFLARKEYIMDRSTLYTTLVRKWHWLGKGEWLYAILFPRAYWDARKRGNAARKRFNDFAASHGYVRKNGKLVKKG
jgi:hypothetical protein